MQEENEQAQEEEVLEQEEQTSGETIETEEQSDEDTVTLSKSELTKLKRKAFAYDSKKNSDKPKQEAKEESTGYDVELMFMLKDLSTDEYQSLKDEADDLGVPMKKYISSQSGKTLLGKVRQQKKSKDSMETLNPKSPVLKKFTTDDVMKMSSKELEKHLPR